MKNTKALKILLFLLLLFFPFFSNGQSLGRERVERLRNSVVDIYIDDEQMGTGFYVAEHGAYYILTCWHVISPALTQDKNGVHIGRKIFIEFMDGQRGEVTGFYQDIFNEGLRDAVGHDYCLMGTAVNPNHKIMPLKTGSFEDIEEGDQVYTCGYPLGIKQQFISTGIISTKFKNAVMLERTTGNDTVVRDAAWLDVTMNRGNSGGPVIRIGRTPDEDEVVAIATFIQSPFEEEAEKAFEKSKMQGADLRFGNGGSQSDLNSLFSLALTNSSYGISGCISINYFNLFVNRFVK